MQLSVNDSAAAALDRGHPWVYREAIKNLRSAAQLEAGAVVDLADSRGRFLGRGLLDPASPIAVRVHERDPQTALDVASFMRRLRSALALRAHLFSAPDAGTPDAGATDAYRLVNGEGDRIPALVIDRYRDVAVLRLDGASLTPWLDRLRRPLSALLSEIGIRSAALRLPREARSSTSARTSASSSNSATPSSATPAGTFIAPLWGPPIPDRMFVRERGLALEVDLHFGHKTGAFLDHRDNLAAIRTLAAGRQRVLNLFSYTGGFSIAAALGGATHITSVDTAGPAHASAQRSFRENGLDPSRHTFVTGDVFAYLEAAHKRGERFDLIISDPPSFAPSEQARPRAVASYRRLHRACAAVLGDGGIFCAASCSSHVTLDDFFTTLDDAALGRGDLRVVSVLGQPADHPWLPAWTEGRYLKLAVLA